MVLGPGPTPLGHINGTSCPVLIQQAIEIYKVCCLEVLVILESNIDHLDKPITKA